MSDRYPLTSDDVGPTAKVGGEPPGRVWGSGVPLGTLWMVLRGWSKKKVACAVPLVRGVRRPTTPGPVFGHVCGMGEVGRQKKSVLSGPAETLFKVCSHCWKRISGSFRAVLLEQFGLT